MGPWSDGPVTAFAETFEAVVWRALDAGATGTATELADRLGADVTNMRRRLAYLMRYGRVAVVSGRGVKGDPLVYAVVTGADAGPAQKQVQGLTARLLNILSDHGDVGRFAAAAGSVGVGESAVMRTLYEALLDDPDGRRSLTRAVAAGAAHRLAAQTEAKAARLRAWAAEARAAGVVE